MPCLLGIAMVSAISPYLTKTNQVCTVGFRAIFVYFFLFYCYNYSFLIVNPHYLHKEKGGRRVKKWRVSKKERHEPTGREEKR